MRSRLDAAPAHGQAPAVRLRRGRVRARLLALREVGLSLAVIVLLWHAASLRVGNAVLLPPPAAVFSAWLRLWRGDLPADILASLQHLFAGYAAGLLTGLVLALLTARFWAADLLIDPLVELLRPISAIAWIPIGILLFGIGDVLPVFIIFYAATFPVYVNTVAGIRSVDRSLLRAAATLGASSRLTITHVILPAALPMILAGARLSLGVGWMVVIAAELVGAQSGLGWRAFWYEQFFSMDRVMAIILTIGVLGFTLDAGMRALQSWLTRWRPPVHVEG